MAAAVLVDALPVVLEAAGEAVDIPNCGVGIMGVDEGRGNCQVKVKSR
jgi:hypothetical protein